MEREILNFDIIGDQRGNLISLENNKQIPFEIKRVYYIFGTGSEIVRGNHAHKDLKQVMICTSGSCKVQLDDGKNKEEIVLDNPGKGLYIKNLIWRIMYSFSADCVMMVLASDYYKEIDYIRDYNEFLEIANNSDSSYHNNF